MKALVEHTIRRKNGTSVLMKSGKTYHFKPAVEGNDPRHVAFVDNTNDLTRFIQIGSDLGTFVLVEDDTEKPSSTAPGAVRGEPEAAAAEGEPAAAVAGPPPEKASDLPLKTTDRDEVLGGMDDERLRETYTRIVGRKPHPDSKSETMIARIKAIENVE